MSVAQAGSGVVHYRDIKHELRTGDLALFHGNSWVSKAIQKFTKNPYSHVGMIVRYRDIAPFGKGEMLGADDDDVYFFESTLARESLPDLLNPMLQLNQPGEREIKHTVHSGVQLVSLKNAFCTYDCQNVGTFNIRQLTAEPNENLDYRRLREFMDQVDTRPFPKMAVLLAHWIEGILGIPCALNTFFCAELVAKSYQALGLIEIDCRRNPPNQYSPSTFSSRTEPLPLRFGGKLSEERVIVMDDCPPNGKKKK